MRVIIAGSRRINDYDLVCRVVRRSGFDISIVVSGGAAGVDKLGERWAHEHLYKVQNLFDGTRHLQIYKAD